MKDYIIFNGVSTADYGVLVFPKDIDSAPKRDVEKIKVPGRNGSIIIDNGRYEDAKLKYTGVIYDHDRFDAYISCMRALFLSGAGYKRLEDTFHPDEYRMVCWDGDFSPKTVRLWHKMGKFELSFSCRPQRYLKTGELEKYFGSARNPGYLYNPTDFPSQPLLKVNVHGSGVVNIGMFSVTITQSYPVTIDCERMDAYDEDSGANYNNRISLSSDFPLLEPGENEISFEGSVTSLNITPRWWML